MQPSARSAATGKWGAPHFPKDMKTTEVQTHENSIRLPALICYVGRRGGGKSSCFYHLMHQLKKDGLVDRLFVISPTAFSPANEAMFRDLGVDYDKDLFEETTNASLMRVKQEVETEGAQWKKDEDDQRKYQRLMRLVRGRTPIDKIDAELLTTAEMEGWLDQPPKTKYGHKPVLHCLIDDAQSSPLYVPSSTSALGNLTCRHRHIGGIGLTMHMCLQNYCCQGGGVPKYVRTNCTVLVLFKIHDQKTIQHILDEVGADVSPSEFLKAYDEAVSQPYRPLIWEAGGKKHIFRAGWNTFLPSSADPRRAMGKTGKAGALTYKPS